MLLDCLNETKGEMIELAINPVVAGSGYHVPELDHKDLFRFDFQFEITSFPKQLWV